MSILFRRIYRNQNDDGSDVSPADRALGLQADADAAATAAKSIDEYRAALELLRKHEVARAESLNKSKEAIERLEAAHEREAKQLA